MTTFSTQSQSVCVAASLSLFLSFFPFLLPHTDPNNSDGGVKIGDFGLATTSGESLIGMFIVRFRFGTG